MKYSYNDMVRLKTIDFFGEYPFMINGHEIPIPRAKDYKCISSPQDSKATTRAVVAGVTMHRDILGILTKVTITYRNMSAEELSKILGYAGYFEKQPFFNLKYINLQKNIIETKKFYITDVESGIDKFGDKPRGDVTLTMVSEKGD